ncbi:hypothetical protein [Xylella fastidiosa]|uniref:hypothetical protein n=1 Tax=Xylella fastidiosa TaxID=2371 RepID=UPI00249E56B1|nr:hypothetical protein [Xylella fastidiosa]WGZ34083.1 hypothetical protein O4445_10645 [Xylella fastidiosa subsp. pauca]WGZ36391.1 hypothetical protein O4443_10550 [Xylella fastidiosa subsp. pauca]
MSRPFHVSVGRGMGEALRWGACGIGTRWGGVSVSSGMFDDGFGVDGLMLWQWYSVVVVVVVVVVCCTVEADRG